jgi:phosphopantothenoylcysteine decarboxylase/phosphopantothenate--cysteine ligase
MSVLAGARIVLCVTGSIAAYKASDLASTLRQAGVEVDVVLSGAAESFIGPLTFQALTQRPVYRASDLMNKENQIAHVQLAKDADVVIVAPASADVIARIAQGRADDLIASIALTATSPIVMAPAMESDMLANAATQANLELLRERGVWLVEPETGRLASGSLGKGRLPETIVLVDVIREVLGRAGPLQGRIVVISAGGTREYLDPVRFIGNPSSGRQGVALARAAIERGAIVRLVMGPSTATPPSNAEITHVESAREMLGELQRATEGCDVLIMNAAVSDYRPDELVASKLKRGGSPPEMKLVENPDVLEGLKGTFIRVGFAAETQDHTANARRKLEEKSLDAMVVNDVGRKDRGFAAETNAVTILRRDKPDQSVELSSKAYVAQTVLDVVVELLEGASDVS